MKSHLYFLFFRKELIYIGQSKNVLKRIYGHLVYHKFTGVRIIECSPDKLSHYEARLIRYFRPKCNRANNPRYKFTSAPNLPIRKPGSKKRSLYDFVELRDLLKDNPIHIRKKKNPADKSVLVGIYLRKDVIDLLGGVDRVRKMAKEHVEHKAEVEETGRYAIHG